MTTATACPSGEYSNTTSNLACTQCPQGHQCSDATLSPVQCPAGSVSAAGSTSCTNCPSG